jgi:hypothetical protein
MEESKKREIEARLQELFARSGLEPSKTERTIQTPHRTVQVIRRRKGRPGRKVA